MLFANLTGIVCAACMAVAPAVAEFENNAVRSVENTSFVASPKRAYYDPNETYGEYEGLFYNYCDSGFNYNSLVSGQPAVLASNSSVATNQISKTTYQGTTTTITLFNEQGQTEDTPCPFDVYINGSLATIDNGKIIKEWKPYSGNSMIYSVVYTGSTEYFWLFDHQEPAPVNAGVEVLGDIAEGITGGIVPVAEGIGSGLQSLVSNIFLDGDGLSTFGIVAICFAGLALALGLSRWIVNFVSSLGARDR